MADWENYLSTPYNKSTPEQVKRAQEFAYALMKPSEGRGSRSWGQPIADILQVIAGQRMLKQSTEADYGQREEAGYRRAGTVEDAQGLLGRRSGVPGPQSSAEPIPVQTKRVQTEAIKPFRTEVARSGDDPSPNADHIADPGATPEDYEKAAKSGDIKPGGFGDQIPPFKTTVETPDPANLDMNAYLKKLSGPESSGGKDLPPNKYGYRGPFALRVGENGLTKEDITHPDPNVRHAAYVRAAINKTKENIEAFKKRSGGVMPTEEALHLMHNQGATGGMAHILADPQQPAWITLKKATPSISDELAKRRIKEQIGSGAALAKVPVDEITSGEFRQYMNDKFNGGWKTRTNTIAGQGADPRAGAMRLGGPVSPEDAPMPKAPGAPEVTPTADTKVAQNLPGVPPPTPLRHPAPNLSREELGKFFADPRIPDEVKDKVHEQINKAATPAERDVVGGKQEFRPGAPDQQNLRGGSDTGTMSVGNISVPYTTYRHPDGKTETLFNIPGHGLGSIEDLKDWSRKQGALDTREGHMAQKYSEKEIDIQNRSEGASKNRDLLRVAKQMANNDAFYSGTGANRVLDYTKLAAYVSGNPNWSGSTEAFSKIMAGANIAGLEAFKGYGQIRNPEIELLQQSQGGIQNTPAAIKAIITLNDRASERLEQIGDKMRAYRDKHKRVDEGFDKELSKFYKDRPLFTDEEIKDYKKVLFGDDNKSAYGRFFGKSIPKDGEPEKPAPAKKRTYIPGQGFVEQ